MGRQQLADVLDAEMAARLLPDSAVAALGLWLRGAGAQYAKGTGSHTVPYTPSRWAAVVPWPGSLADRSGTGSALLSRGQAVSAVRDALAREEWAEALVASYVWGQGRTGYGPHRLAEILNESGVADRLAEAAEVLRSNGAVASYGVLRGAVKGLGPAFFTKLLYFLGPAVGSVPPTAPLILDMRVARVLRAYAAGIGEQMGEQSAAKVAAWIWSDGGWTPHRYDVYLRWMTAASEQVASAGIGWPPACPDLLELAFFEGRWNPTA